MAKPFKRYFTKPEHITQGKGDWRRDTQISDRNFAENWCQTFGHRMTVGTTRCAVCGKDLQ